MEELADSIDELSKSIDELGQAKVSNFDLMINSYKHGLMLLEHIRALAVMGSRVDVLWWKVVEDIAVMVVATISRERKRR